MQVEYKLKIGSDEFTLKAEVKDEKEFLEEMSFYSNLPRTAPNGATDLKLVFRTTSEGHKYYSIISEKEKMEFKFGQNKEKKGNGLYPKGWEQLYGADEVPQQNPLAGLGAPAPQPQAPAPQLAPMPAYQPPKPQAPTIGMVPQQPVAPAQPVFNNPFPTTQTPVPQQQMAPMPTNPTPQPQAPIPNMSFPGMVAPHIGPSAGVATAPQPQGTPAPTAPSPEIAAAKQNVLDRFNIKKS
jgi:hypothetical protein